MSDTETSIPSTSAADRPSRSRLPAEEVVRDSCIGWWALPLIVAAAVLPYLSVLDAPFVFDDQKLVVDNDLLRVDGPEAFDRILASFDVYSREFDELDVRENYRPLRFLSYWIDFRLTDWYFSDEEGGTTQAGEPPPVLLFHLQNIFWHLANTLLVWRLSRRLLSSEFGGLACAMIFALHPIATEAVTYVSGRRDVLSTFFFLLALTVYLRRHALDRVPWWTVLAVPALFALGYLAKEMVITLPAVLLLVDLARRARPEPRRVLCHLLCWVVAGFALTSTLGNPNLIDRAAGGEEASIFGNLLTACRFTAHYFSLLFAPFSQSIDYSWDALPGPALLGPEDSPWTVHFLLGWTLALMAVGFVLLLIVGGIWALWGKRYVLAVGLLWFPGTLLPVLQFVPIPERFAERFAYLPAIGIYLLVATITRRLRRFEPELGWGLLCGMSILLGALTVFRNADWKTPVALWGSAVEAQPRCARAWLAYGEALQVAGDAARAQDAYETSDALFDELEDERAAAKKPMLPLHTGLRLRARTALAGLHFAEAGEDRRKLATVQRELSDLLDAVDSNGRRVGSSPEYALIRFEFASVYFALGNLVEARTQYQQVIATGGPPGVTARAWYQIAKIDGREGKPHVALSHLEDCIREMPADDPSRVAVLREIAELQLSGEKPDRDAAWETLERALAADPSDAELIGIRMRRAQLLDQRAEVNGAIRELERALDVDREHIEVLLTLAGFEKLRGNRERAKELFAAVLRVNPRELRAREGLADIRLQEDVEGPGQGAQADKTLAGIFKGAQESLEGGKIIEARSRFDKLRQKAGELDRTLMVARAYRGIAVAERKLGRRDEAVHAVEQALKLDENRTASWALLGTIYLEDDGDADLARGAFEESLSALRPGKKAPPGVYRDLALLTEREDPARALALYRQAVEVGIARADPRGECAVQDGIGRMLAETGDHAAAFEVLNGWLERGCGTDEERVLVQRFLDERVAPSLIGER